MRIEILCTGDEILSGKTVNTNYSHMACRLQEAGLDVAWGTTVGDSRERLAAAFRLASQRADAVIVNGGLGPTVDDLSQEVAAEAAGVELVLDENWVRRIETFYSARGRGMPPNNVKQAMLPEGSEFIDNPIGTACGFAIYIGQARFFFTPGVPREIKLMLDQEIIPRLLKMSGTRAVVALKRFHSFGLGKSRVDDVLKPLEPELEQAGVKLGFQAHYPQLETKLLAKGYSQEEAAARLAPFAQAVRQYLGSYLLAEDTETLEGALLRALTAKGATLAVAECGTHGAVASRLAAHDSAGTVFARGTLGASSDSLARAVGCSVEGHAPPASRVAAIARAARTAAHTSLGLAVLMEPGDVPAEGWVHIAIAKEDDEPICRSACLLGAGEQIRAGGVELALDCVRRLSAGLSVADVIDFEKRPSTRPAAA